MKQEKTEQVGRLMIAEADDYEEVAEVSEGNICAVTGLKVSNIFKFVICCFLV